MRWAEALCAAGLMAAASVPVHAQNPQSDASASFERPCVQGDLIGTYALVDFREEPVGHETEWFRRFPHQFLAFYPPDVVASVSSNVEQTTADRIDPQLKRQAKVGKSKYFLGTNSVLQLSVPHFENVTFRCGVGLRASGNYKIGDMFLSGYTSETKTTLYKVYRRWY